MHNVSLVKLNMVGINKKALYKPIKAEVDDFGKMDTEIKNHLINKLTEYLKSKDSNTKYEILKHLGQYSVTNFKKAKYVKIFAHQLVDLQYLYTYTVHIDILTKEELTPVLMKGIYNAYNAAIRHLARIVYSLEKTDKNRDLLEGLLKHLAETDEYLDAKYFYDKVNRKRLYKVVELVLFPFITTLKANLVASSSKREVAAKMADDEVSE